MQIIKTKNSGILKIDEDSKIYMTIFEVISESDFFRATSDLILKDYLSKISLKPNFTHDDSRDFLLVLNRYFLEHGFEVSKQILKDKIKELTGYTLKIYNEKFRNSQTTVSTRKRVYKPFNELEGEISIPRECYGDIITNKNGRYAFNHVKNQVGVLGNISISVKLERRVFDHEQQLWIFLRPDLPESVNSIDVSLFKQLKTFRNFHSTKMFFNTRQNIR